MIGAERLGRFRGDLRALIGDPPGRIGIAVSGGPDSLALLLLAAAALPGRVAAATVDHGLRPESADEAAMVADLCVARGIPHAVLAPPWDAPPQANVPAAARLARYRALVAWAGAEGIGRVATGHHMDDQAETVLMRLARGAGLGGLAGMPATGGVVDGQQEVTFVRPLLGWRKAELEAIVAEAGIAAADDPTNRSDRLDRTRFRELLANTPLLPPERLAQAAANLAEAEAALAWTVARLVDERVRRQVDAITLDAAELPRELQRRLVLHVLGAFTDAAALPGPKVMRLIDALAEGRAATLAGVRAAPGRPWTFATAPPHRTAG